MCAHRIHNEFITSGIIKTAWRHGKSESTPSLTKVFRRRTSRLNFFAKITSAPMSFHFCADGVAVLGTVWIPAAQSKRQSSAGACVDENSKIAQPAWGAISQPPKRSKSKQTRKSHSGRPGFEDGGLTDGCNARSVLAAK